VKKQTIPRTPQTFQIFDKIKDPVCKQKYDALYKLLKNFDKKNKHELTLLPRAISQTRCKNGYLVPRHTYKI
jgi:hypothetical protein